MTLRSVNIDLPDGTAVSALLLKPPRPIACFVFAHGAGADMNHPFMRVIAEKLAGAKVATLRYQFPYTQARAKRPDRPAVCHATVRAAVAAARTSMPRMLLIAGGKSFGGRMTSQAQALEPLAGVAGLAFFGFPWHLPKAPSLARSEHLDAIRVPMLFLQGARDPMGEKQLIAAQFRQRLKHSQLCSIADADHGFHVPARSGQTDSDVQDRLVSAFVQWAANLARNRRNTAVAKPSSSRS